MTLVKFCITLREYLRILNNIRILDKTNKNANNNKNNDNTKKKYKMYFVNFQWIRVQLIFTEKKCQFYYNK